MSIQAITFDEMQEKNAFIQADLERVNTKALNLKESLQEYIKETKSKYDDIQDSLHTINNQLVFSDVDKNSLLDIEKDIDKLAIEIREKQLITTIERLATNILKATKARTGKIEDTLQCVKLDAMSILYLIGIEKKE